MLTSLDIARKRNVSLMLAHLISWRTITYLDDDIRDLTTTAVARAADLMTRFQAVGFEISHYPYDSVVCHAHRLTDGNRGVFPGGSALLIDFMNYSLMFAPIYNED